VPVTDTHRAPAGLRAIRSLGEGGMGAVILAVRREGAFERRYAVKRLLPVLRDDTAARTAFLDEAKLAGQLYHPNVVRVFDAGEDEDGPYMVLEYIDGFSLVEVVRRAGARGEAVPLEVGLELMRDVALGLRAAHEARDLDDRPLGLIHRDLSPANVLVGLDGVARLADFGIARGLGRSSKTTQAILKGKMGYMAPEVLRFEEPTQRADLFAFGVVLFELLTGKRLYSGSDVAQRILNEPQPDILDFRPGAPPELVALLFALLAKDPTSRPRSARAVVRTLETVLARASEDAEEELLLASEYLPILARVPRGDATTPGMLLPD
jgi:serine/threonine protein kinase